MEGTRRRVERAGRNGDGPRTMVFKPGLGPIWLEVLTGPAAHSASNGEGISHRRCSWPRPHGRRLAVPTAVREAVARGHVPCAA